MLVKKCMVGGALMAEMKKPEYIVIKKETEVEVAPGFFTTFTLPTYDRL